MSTLANGCCMTTFYVLWILIGSNNTQSIAVDHFATLQECEAAMDGFIADYNSMQYYGSKLKGEDARWCRKLGLKL